MGKRLIVGTSTGAIDFAPERYKNLGIRIIPLFYTYKGVEYQENKVDAKAYYKELESINSTDDMPRTSMAKVTDIKDWLWLESEVVKNLGYHDDIDYGYFESKAIEAKETISQFGDLSKKLC